MNYVQMSRRFSGMQTLRAQRRLWWVVWHMECRSGLSDPPRAGRQPLIMRPLEPEGLRKSVNWLIRGVTSWVSNMDLFSQCSYFLRNKLLGFQWLWAITIRIKWTFCRRWFSREVKMFSTGCLSKVSLPFTAGYRSACQPSQEWISLRG